MDTHTSHLPVGHTSNTQLLSPCWNRQECLLQFPTWPLLTLWRFGFFIRGQLWKPWHSSRLSLKLLRQGGEGIPHYSWSRLPISLGYPYPNHWLYRRWGSLLPLSREESLFYITLVGKLGCLITASQWQKSRLLVSLCWQETVGHNFVPCLLEV